MNADLHTDLANKEEREKITLAGRKVKTGAEAITNPNEGGVNNIKNMWTILVKKQYLIKKTGEWIRDGINDPTYNVAVWENDYKFNELNIHFNLDVKLWEREGVGPQDKLNKLQRKEIIDISKYYFLDKNYRNFAEKYGKASIKNYQIYLYEKYRKGGDE